MEIQNSILHLQNETMEMHEQLEKWVAENSALLEIFLDAYCVVDSKNHVVAFNEAFMELTGESYRKILKTGDLCTLLPTTLCQTQCPSKTVLTSGKALRLDEVGARSKSFAHLELIFSGVPIVINAKQAGALLTVRNVTAESLLQKKYDERKKESILDGLTQLYNKAYTEAMLLRLIKTAIRNQDNAKLSIVMCDIDHFKKVNDTYGHQAGDKVLSAVAKLLKDSARETDFVGRFGGEEFVCVLTASDIKGSWTFCERFRKEVSELSITHDGKKIPVTVSLGTATIVAKPIQGKDPTEIAKDLVSKADTALYAAKKGGRNKTCQHETLKTHESSNAA